MGSNGAGQAVLDAAPVARHLAADSDPTRALRGYQDERLPATTEIVLRNRTGGPEAVIDEVKRRAPDGFTDRSAVLDDAELAAALAGYAQAGAPNPPTNGNKERGARRGRVRGRADNCRHCTALPRRSESVRISDESPRS